MRTCVHCGFCNATCPTYQLLGNELDGPRGRIYLIKQMLETGEANASTRLHLDRCLTCRNCETTCPSGVRYSRLLDVGRLTVEDWAGPRPLAQRLQRRLLRASAAERVAGQGPASRPAGRCAPCCRCSSATSCLAGARPRGPAPLLAGRAPC